MNKKVLDNVRIIQKSFIVDSEGKILVLRRPSSDKSRPNAWDIPGGGYEQGENIQEAIVREIQEETSLKALSLVPFYLDNRISSKSQLFSGINVFVVGWQCSEWVGEVALSREHTESRWVTPQEFRQLYFGSDDGFFVKALDNYLTYSKK